MCETRSIGRLREYKLHKMIGKENERGEGEAARGGLPTETGAQDCQEESWKESEKKERKKERKMKREKTLTLA